MNGELAQLIALVAHGNYFLTHPEIHTLDLSTNSTFNFVNSLCFALYKNKSETKGTEIASSVADWFTILRQQGVKRLWNIGFQWDHANIAEHIAVAFSGGVPIAVESDSTQDFVLWYPKWTTGGPSGKPWNVEYRGLHFPFSHAIELMELDEVKTKLHLAISQADDFSRHCGLDLSFFADRFAQALNQLDSQKPVMPFNQDLLPECGYGLVSRQVLAAAQLAYVFGGMGSWNDLGFPDPDMQKQYESISNVLYQAVKLSILMASNTFSC